MERAESPTSSQPFFNPLMIALVATVSTAVLLTTYHLLVAKFCLSRRQATTHAYYIRDTATGVDEKVLDSIPVHSYRQNEEKLLGGDQCECAVCLGEFEEGEPVRLLPNCHHVFHLQCIDEWFISHSNCPLCRSPIIVPTSSELPVIDDTSGLLDEAHESQNQGGIAISNARKSSRLSLLHSSSVLLSVERKPRLSLARFKRSISDCSYVSIKIHLEHEHGPSSSSTTCSCSSKVEYSRSSSGRQGFYKQMEYAPAMRMNSFSRIRLSQGGAASEV